MSPIKHNYTSPVSDNDDPDEVGPDEWNDDHDTSTHTISEHSDSEKAIAYDLSWTFLAGDEDIEIPVAVARACDLSAAHGQALTTPSAVTTFEGRTNSGTPFDLFDVATDGTVSASSGALPISLSAGDTLSVIAPSNLNGADRIALTLEGQVT